MTTTATEPTAPLIGHFVPEILSLAKRGLLWAVLYSIVARASAGGCLGPGTSDTDPGTVCFTATLNPSPLAWLAMAVVFVVAVGRAAKASDTGAIARTLSRAATALWFIPLVAAVLGVWSFLATPAEAWVHGTPPSHVSVQISPG